MKAEAEIEELTEQLGGWMVEDGCVCEKELAGMES